MAYTTGVVTTADFEGRQTYDKPSSTKRSVKRSTKRKTRGNPKALPKRTKRKGS